MVASEFAFLEVEQKRDAIGFCEPFRRAPERFDPVDVTFLRENPFKL
jgi:hypothetical protein